MALDNELTWQANAAAALLEAQKKTKRGLGQKKSRQGCITCKIRRVKCDETHPECNRCTSTGRKCDGYLQQQKPKARGTSLIGSQLSQTLGLRASDVRTFDYFLSWTAPRLAGAMDKDFWCGQVLQIAHSEPSVLDGLLALSLLYEHPQFMESFRVGDNGLTVFPETDLEIEDASKSRAGYLPVCEDESLIHPSMRPRGPLDKYHAEALNHYNRAIAALKGKLSSGEATPMLALMSCAIFIYIEIIRDDVYAALALFTKGKSLLRNVKPCGSAEEELFTTIKLMFARLGVLAVVFGHTDPLEIPPEFVAVSEHRVYSSMADARTALFALMAGSHSFISEAALYIASLGVELSDAAAVFGTTYIHFDPMAETGQAVLPATFNVRSGAGPSPKGSGICDGFGEKDFSLSSSVEDTNGPGMRSPPTDSVPEHLLAKQAQLEIRLGQWFDAFQWTRGADDEAASTLLMHYHVSFIWQTTRLSPFQTVFDDYAYHFQEILRFAEIYVNAISSANTTFTSEIGVIPPLYFVATKCRIPSYRRRAIRLLLRAPKKECMWGARSVAEAAARLTTIEEEGMNVEIATNGAPGSIIDDSILPAEHKRIHNTAIFRNVASGGFEVLVTRYAESVNGWRRKSVQRYPV